MFCTDKLRCRATFYTAQEEAGTALFLLVMDNDR